MDYLIKEIRPDREQVKIRSHSNIEALRCTRVMQYTVLVDLLYHMVGSVC